MLSAFTLLLALSCLTPAARAATVAGIQSKNTQPVIARTEAGGVLMLPLTATRHGTQWPATINLLTADKQTFSGLVAWIEPMVDSFDRQWTHDLRGLRIRAVQPGDDSAAVPPNSTLGPYLLARLPHAARGPLQLGKQTITPQWQDLQSEGERGVAGDDDDRPRLALNPAPDRPDPTSPFEYWRWVLLAERLEMSPPSPWEGGGEVATMAAEHYASLWQIGLQRLARQSPRIAEQCRDMLTKTCIDRRQPFAAWVADPEAVAALLARLLDLARSDAMVLSDVVTWIDEQPALYFWPEMEFGEEVRLAMITPRLEPVIAKFQWLGESSSPLVARLEPGVIAQVTIARPPLPRALAIGLPPPPEAERQVLIVEAMHQRFEIPFGQRVVRAKPPGVFFRPLAPPLTLAEVQMRQQRLMSETQATFAQVRRLAGRWEVFIECRRSAVELESAGDLRSSAVAAGGSLPDVIDSYEDLRGVEAITILLGAQPAPPPLHAAASPQESTGPRVWVTVPEQGFWKIVQTTAPNDGTLQIHKRSLRDRWYCRIVLPESWFSAAECSPALVGFVRSHGDTNQLETGPNPSTPWRPAPTRAAIDLEPWDDMPRE